MTVPPSSLAPIHVIGGGLAGSEAAWQIANAGVPVILHEMRPAKGTFAHKTGDCAEMVCSNSFRSDDDVMNAVGQLHWEMRAAGGLIGVSVLLAAWSFALPFVFGLGPRQVPWWREVFDVNHEANLTAWWSSGLLLLGAAGFTTVGLVRRALGADRRRSLLAWLTPAALLAAMSLDESTQIHEQAGQLWEALPFAGENPLPAFQWLILGAPAAAPRPTTSRRTRRS